MFMVDMAVGHPDGGDLAPVSVVVETGAEHTILPASLLARVNLTPREKRQFMLAGGSRAEYGYGLARISIDGVEWLCPVIFGPEECYMLGASTLEMFNLEIDHIQQRLRPAKSQWLGQVAAVAEPSTTMSAGQAILAMFDELHKSAPPGAFDELPTDGARNYKHYLYGFPKDED